MADKKEEKPRKPDLSAWDKPNVGSTVVKKGRERKYPSDK